MKPPVSFVGSHLFLDRLRAEVSQLRRALSCWLSAALISSGLAGVGILSSGIVIGAELHKSGYIVGGVLAVLCLLLFACLQEAWSVVCVLLGLLELDDAISREDIMKKLTAYMHKHATAKRSNISTTVIPENSDYPDFDEAMQQAMKGLPAKFLNALSRALQQALFVALVASISAVTIFLLDVPFLSLRIKNQISALPITFASLVMLGAICGFVVRMRAASVIHKIAFQQVDFDNQKSLDTLNLVDHTDCPAGTSPLRATLLEVHMNMLRRKLASTAKGLVLKVFTRLMRHDIFRLDGKGVIVV